MITLADMVRNGSVSEAGAALLGAIGAMERSFIVYALPRNAGKSTAVAAILGAAPSAPSMRFLGSEEEANALLAAPGSGYLVVAEISPAPMSGYLWQEEVRRLFDLASAGFALATSLHADNIDDAFAILCEENDVPDKQAALVHFMVKVRTLGPTSDPRSRRVIASVHEVLAVRDGRPETELLYRFDAANDRFETVAPSRTLPG